MTMKKMFRGITNALVAILGVSLFIPLALAANPVIQNVTISPTPFFSNVPGQTAQLDIQYDYNTGGFATGPVIEQVLASNGKVVYEFGANGADDKATAHYTLKWDGKCNVTYGGAPCTNGNYVDDGQYKIGLSSTTASPPAAVYESALFDVAQTKVPVVTLTSTPATTYVKNSGNYNVNYNLVRNSGSAWIVRLKIKSLSSSDEAVIAEPKTTDGAMTINWDGKFSGTPASAGSYSYDLWAPASVNGYSVESTPLTGNFTITLPGAPTAAVSTLKVTPDPFDPSTGLLNLSYNLSNSTGAATITASVYSSSNLSTPIKTWGFTNQSNGNNSMTWDGKDALNNKVPDGSYVYRVGGNDGANTIANQDLSFTVATAAVSTTCAGFTDVASNDADCPAITYVKSLGAMTGNPDGTFAPQGLLQRDQIMKIVLETFKKFDKVVNYCNGVLPFPDVAESSWAFQYICRAKQIGITTGYQSGPDAGYYRPARSVNRIEFLALVLRNLSETMPANTVASYNDVATGQWFTGYAKYAYDNLLFNKPNLFPTKFMVRVEVARVLYKLHQLGKV